MAIRAVTVSLMLLALCGNTAAVELHVSVSGDDSGPGTVSRPFKTVSAAQATVRRMVAAGLTEDVTVVIHGGAYYLQEPLTITPADSGTDISSITYTGAANERATLIGGTRVTGWKRHQGDIWTASLPANAKPKQAFENGTRLVTARWPDKDYLMPPRKEDYLSVKEPADGFGRTFAYYPEQYPDRIAPSKWNVVDASIFIWPGYDWFSQENSISAVEPDAKLIVMGSGGGARQWNRYYISNILSLLDRRGECQIDRSNGKLYVWPRTEPIEQQTIVVPTIDHVVHVAGSDSTNIVRNVHFRNLEIGIAEDDAVRMRNATDCSVEGCLIENARGCGVGLAGRAERISVRNNLIRYNGWHGVAIEGLGPQAPDVSHDNIVDNNHIHHCGLLVGHSYGVRIRASGSNRITHNLIHHFPRHGISIKGYEYSELLKTVANIEPDTYYRYLYSSNNTFAFNHIHHVNQDSQDSGAMESWNAGRGNVYHHNLIHDVGNELYTLQTGIYLDSGSDFFTVANNIVYNVKGLSAYCLLVRGSNNTITNNIFVAGPGTHAALRWSGWDERTRENTFSENIVLFEPGCSTLHLFTDWRDDLFKVCDRNIYWAGSSTRIVVKGSGPGLTYEDRKKAVKGRFDEHSTVADPLFVNAGNHDFRLKRGSPATAQGFKQIETGAIGLRPDYPAELKRLSDPAVNDRPGD